MELLIYKASAGSGKTFTLAIEYIKQLIRNPFAYRQILAVTFTNKATSEMKGRILQQLYGIWKGNPASDAYLKKIEVDFNSSVPALKLTTEEICQRAGTALLCILHDYDNFRVETIDAFFLSVIRSLARELELNHNLNIELDQAKVLNEAVDGLLEKLTVTSPALSWLLTYIDERITQDKRWDVSDIIKKFGANIFNESYIEKGQELRNYLQTPHALRAYQTLLRGQEAAALKQMKSFSERFDKILSDNGLTPDCLIRGNNGIASYFRNLQRGVLSDQKLMTATLKNCLESAENWVSKTSKQRNEIIALAERELKPLLQEAERCRAQNVRNINSCRLSLQHLNALQLLNDIDKEVRLQNQEHNCFLLSDTNTLLHSLIGEGDSSFVFEKIGANIRTVMIDEFQDTSRMQWGNFRLLLLEGLSQGADSLIVGDVKQSIYRWRNSDWSILNNLGRDNQGLGQFPIRIETLKTNRRSEAHIILFNNQFFTSAVACLNRKHVKELKEECAPLVQAYSDVVQDVARTTTQGYVQVELFEADSTDEYRQQTLQALSEEVSRLLDAGIAPRQIAILIRKKKYIPLIAEHFEQTLHLSIVSNEAFQLNASLAICMLIDALRYISCPDDKISLATLVYNYQRYIVKAEDVPADSIIRCDGEQQLPPEFTEQMEKFRLMPLHELLEELYICFRLDTLEQQDAYLFTFYDAVTEYLQNHSSDLGNFLQYWDATLCSKTIPGDNVEGIRIMSIHQSKGLEFHTVLIPFADWKLENETNDQLVWCTPDSEPYNTLNLVPVNYSKTMADSCYRTDYLHERLQLWVDNLNLLYVAFTRAGKNLFIWSRCDQSGTVGELISEVLPTLSGDGWWEEENHIYRQGELYTATGQEVQTPLTDNIEVKMQSLPPHVEFRQSNRSADFMAEVGKAEEASSSTAKSPYYYINRGQMMHTLFANIRTPDDIDTAIDRLVFDGIISDKEDVQTIRQQTHQAFSLPQVRQWYDGSWQVLAERDIVWMENGVLQNRRPDRVMKRGDEIAIVDFKFGSPRKEYDRQIALYIELLTRMGYDRKQISGYLWYVDKHMVVQHPQ